MNFSFQVSTLVDFGTGASSRLLRTLTQQGFTSVGIVVDHNVINTDAVGDLLAGLKSSGSVSAISECTVSEPSYGDLDNMRGQFSLPDIQAIIGIGGGSTIDMAKAMAVLVHNADSAITYRGFDKMKKPVLPIIAVPTTAGTGSEITPNASFIDTQAKRKMGINGEQVRPKYAFLDPEMTLSCPLKPTISSGVDSMVHAIEAFVAKRTNPIARHFAAEGFKRVLKSLPPLTERLDDIALRTEVMYGAFLSGVALMHSGTGPAAAMSYPLSVHYGVSHGIGGGIFMPYVVRHNIDEGYLGYGNMLPDDLMKNDKDLCGLEEVFYQKLAETWAFLGVPDTLGGHEIDPDTFISETLELSGALEQNPVTFGREEVAKVLSLACPG